MATEAVPGGAVIRGGGVQSVGRALDLLETLAASDVPLGVGEVARRVGLPQGTAHRLLHSLEQRGYVHHGAHRKYSVGGGALRLAEAAQRSLARSARPYLAEMVAFCGETANLAVLEGDDVVYIAQVPSPHTLRMFAEVGKHVSPHSTAVGKVLLAGLPPERVVPLARRTGLPANTPHTITDLDALLAELDLTRARGWGVDEEEHELGVRCVAVPVREGSLVVAAMSVSGPSGRFAGAGHPGLVRRMAALAVQFVTDVMGAGDE